MPSHDLIVGYLAQVRAVVVLPRDSDAIAAELEDHHSRITPLPPDVGAQAAAWPVALVVFAVADKVTGLGPKDEYGDYPWACFVGGTVFAVLWALGQFAMGRLLVAERSVDVVVPALVA